MEDKLVDHEDGSKLLSELLNGKGDKIACNVLELLKTFTTMLDDLNMRITTIEGLIDV